MTSPKRTVHSDVSAAARLLGRKGGLATSAKKKKSSAANGQKGGRPRTIKTIVHESTERILARLARRKDGAR